MARELRKLVRALCGVVFTVVFLSSAAFSESETAAPASAAEALARAARKPQSASELRDLVNSQIAKFPQIKPAIKSTKASFADAVKLIVMTEPLQTNNPKVRSGKDTADFEDEFALDFVNKTNKTGVFDDEEFRTAPESQLFYVDAMYHMERKPSMQAIDTGAKNGFALAIGVTDFNDYIKLKNLDGKKSSSNFSAENIEYNKGEMGENLEWLVSQGHAEIAYPEAKLKNPNHFITSQPWYDPHAIREKPIYHKKIRIAGIFEKDLKTIRKVRILYGDSNNSSAKNKRVDSLIISDDIAVATPDYLEILADAETFEKGGKISDNTENNWTKVEFKDGSSVTVTHQKGVYNTNNYIAKDFLDHAMGDAVIDEASAAEFTSTFSQGNQAIAYAQEKKRIPQEFVVDMGFADTAGYGGLPLFDGYFLDRGGEIDGLWPFSDTVDEAVTSYTYIRPIPGNPPKSLFGMPQNYIMHMKAFFRVVTTGAKKLCRLAYGSWNWSSHMAASAHAEVPGNAESQWQIEEPAGAASITTLFRDYFHSIAQSQYSVKGALGPFMLFLSRFSHVAPEDIPQETAQKIFDDVKAQNFEAVSAGIMDLLKLENTISQKEQLSRADLQHKTDTLINGVKTIVKDFNVKVTPQKLVEFYNLSGKGHASDNPHSRAGMKFALGGAQNDPETKFPIDKAFDAFNWGTVPIHHRVTTFVNPKPGDKPCVQPVQTAAKVLRHGAD